MLAPTQSAALAADINANSVEFADAIAAKNPFIIAAAYSETAVPDFYVWKTWLSNDEIRNATVWTELIGRSDGERFVYGVLLDNGGINAADPNIQQAFLDIFSGPSGATSRANLVAAAKRLARRGEKLLAAGTGSLASPATMTHEGAITAQDVATAMGW